MEWASRALAALAAWAIAVPWMAEAVGLGLDVPAALEVIDHVVPGVVVLACSALLLRARVGAVTRLAAESVACLAGVWITAAHAVLLPEAIDGITPWGPALLHLSAGPPVTLLAGWMVLAEAGR